MAVQCCEHLNRAVVIEREVAAKYGFEEVNVIPQPHAGGAFAVEAYLIAAVALHTHILKAGRAVFDDVLIYQAVSRKAVQTSVYRGLADVYSLFSEMIGYLLAREMRTRIILKEI